MSQDWCPYPRCLEPTDLLSLDLHVLQGLSSQGTEALTGSVLQSRCTELLAKPRRQSLAGGGSRELGAPRCTAAHVSRSTRPTSGRPELLSLCMVKRRRNWDAGSLLAVVRRDLNSELPSPSNRAPGKAAVGVVAGAVPLCGKECATQRYRDCTREGSMTQGPLGSAALGGSLPAPPEHKTHRQL